MSQRLATNIVPEIGPRDAKIAFIGEAPGEEEDAALEPFIGAAGSFLNRVLIKKGIIRSEVLIANVFNQRPPKNKVNYFYQDSKNTVLTWEGELHEARLRRWLTELRSGSNPGPNILVALGRTALYHLTGKKRIKKWRGSILPCTLVPGYKVYPTYHPSNIQRMLTEPREKLYGEKKKEIENALPLFEVDFDRIKIQAEFPELRKIHRTFEINLSHSEIITKLKDILSRKPELLACDIETLFGEEGWIIWCIGFAESPESAFTIPMLRRGKFAWSLEEEAQVWYMISRIFLDQAITKIFQGGMYDLAILGRYYGLRLGRGSHADTMYCHHASYPYLRKSLEVLASMYTWEPYYKDEGRVSFGKRTDDAQFNYNCKDCAVTREIFPITLRNSKELGAYNTYLRTMDVLPSHLGMTIRGIRFDIENQKKLGKKFGALAREFQAKVVEEVGYELNLKSSDQKRKLLYGYLGLQIQFHLKTKKATVDKDALNKLKKKYPDNPILEWILQYQKYSVLNTTYTAMRPDIDGRIHTSYSWVVTWRTNSRSSPFGGFSKSDREGGNLQNVPVKGEEGKAIRSLFVPDRGKVLVSWDYRAAEAMVKAWDAVDLERIQLFLDGWNVHWFNAQKIFDIPENIPYKNEKKVKFHSPVFGVSATLYTLRQLGKVIEHASSYGMGPYKLQTELAKEGFVVPFAQCKNLLASHKRRNPFTDAWQREIRSELRATRTLISPIGDKRQFLGRFGPDLWNAGYAFKPQNTVGRITQISIQKTWEKLDYFEMLLNVHDQGIGQCAPKDVNMAIADIKELARLPVMIKGRELTIPTDFSVGPSWGELEEIE